jgi:hypothetical protein
MTRETLQALINAGDSTPGQLWAAFEQLLAEETDSAVRECATAKQDLQLVQAAVNKAQLAIESKNPEVAAEALAAIDFAKKSESERKIAELNESIAKLQEQKEALISGE